MGHLNKDALANTQSVTTTIPTISFKTKALCSVCLKDKQKVTEFPSHSQSKTSRVLEHVNTDKSEVARRFESFKTMYENQWGERIKCLRSDNGTEFVNKVMDEICQRNGIVRQKTVPYSPQQYGVAERMNRTIIKKARSMVHCKGLSSSWWEETISTAVYFINRTTNSTHTDATPYAIGFKMKPRLDHLRVFRSMGYAHVEDAKRTKIELKSFKCMFLGYGDNTKGYRVYDLEPNKVKMSRSVKVDEREVNWIYSTSMTGRTEVINMIKDIDEVAQRLNLRTKMILTMTILSIRRHPNDLVLIKTTCLQKLY
ncbi:unnamed protein product [Peronospora farinosa]|uniref:Integrase catalytic domain-containing protein n=1 Tax=Peronospora farinosa TaxID=134698 RepID=A0AAV0UKX8_9STRA|nr:unnamed protein product [Peronospora farinosa]